MLYAVVRTPGDGTHVYRLGDHEGPADPVVGALLDGIRAAHAMPADWSDEDKHAGAWSLSVGGPLDPEAIERVGATTHDLTAE